VNHDVHRHAERSGFARADWSRLHLSLWSSRNVIVAAAAGLPDATKCHRAIRRQRVNPELGVPPAGITAAPLLTQNQVPGSGLLAGTPAASRGRGAVPIGIHQAQPQNLPRRLPPTPGAEQGIVPAGPGLIAPAHPRVQREAAWPRRALTRRSQPRSCPSEAARPPCRWPCLRYTTRARRRVYIRPFLGQPQPFHLRKLQAISESAGTYPA
jgi:hypothetical protein